MLDQETILNLKDERTRVLGIREYLLSQFRDARDHLDAVREEAEKADNRLMALDVLIELQSPPPVDKYTTFGEGGQ